MQEIKICPVCSSDKFKPFIKCFDYTVSDLEFSIIECDSCGFKLTSPRPEDDDLGKFYKAESYISHTDSKKGLINRIYHFVRTYTLVKKFQLVLRTSRKKKGRILDYGCGTGAFLLSCKQGGWDAIGYEPDSDAREFGRNKHQVEIFSSISDPALIARSFDVISLWHVIEHIPDLKAWFDTIGKLLSPDGSLIVACPNCSSFDAKYYGRFWAAYDVPRHLWHFTPETIERLFSAKGYKLVAIRPMVFDSFYVSMLSEKYKGSGLGFFKAIFIGFISNLRAMSTGRKYSSQIYIFRKS